MRRYLHFARAALEDHMKGQVRQCVRFAVFAALAWVLIALWRVIYDSGYGAPGISRTQMSWYNGLAQMMFFLSPRIFAVVDEDVRSGNIAYFLTRPVPYLWMRFSEGAGALCGMLVLYFTLGTAWLYFLIGAWPEGGFSHVAAGLAGIGVGSVLHLLFQMGCGLSAFWTQDAVFSYYVYQKLIILLGGIYMPLALYPKMLSGTVLQYLPFSAMVNGPAHMAFVADLAPAFCSLLLLQTVWIFAAGVCLEFIYSLCLRGIEINGG